jgi:hypothetical protein
MNRTQLSKSLTIVFATVVSSFLTAPTPLLAEKPSKPHPCIVGHTHGTIQSAVDDARCAAINVPEGTFYENVIINREVTVRGAGPDSTIVDGNGSGPVFNLVGTPTIRFAVTLKGMTITHGTGPGELSTHRNGGGITSAYADLTVKDAVVAGNSAFGNGGGISFVYGSLTVKDSVITNNTAMAYYPDRPGVAGGGGLRGGGVPNTLVVVDSVIAGNVSWGQGGGIITVSLPDSGALVVKDCLITDNEAKDMKGLGYNGGGIYVDGTSLTVKDSEITDNIPDDFYPAP